MAEDSGSSRRSPFPALPAVALMLIVSAVVFQVAPLKSSRPQHDPLPELGKGFGERVRARLWQDPLQTVYAEHAKRKKEGRKGDLAAIKDELGAINDSLAMSTAPGETEPDWRLNLKINRGTQNGTAGPEFGGDDSEDRKTDQPADPKTPSLGDYWGDSRVAQSFLVAQIPNLLDFSGFDVFKKIDASANTSTIAMNIAGVMTAKIDDAANKWAIAMNIAGVMTAKIDDAWKISRKLTESIDLATVETTGEEVGYRGLLLLSVMLHGGPYPEDAENRMRTRYAVLSALGQAGYKPEESEHIRYVDFGKLLERTVPGCEKGASYREEGKKTGGEPRKRNFLIPFERFGYSKIVPERASEDFTPVYVVWIDEDALKDRENVVNCLDRTEFAWRLSRTLAIFEEWLRPQLREEIILGKIKKATPRALSRIQQLVPLNEWSVSRSEVQSQVQADLADRFDRFKLKTTKYRVIGPVSSDSLLDLRRVRRPPNFPGEPQFPRLQVYSPWATVADQVFECIERSRGNNSEASSRRAEHGPHEFSEAPPYFSLIRTTATDAPVFRSLFRELELRDASPFRSLISKRDADGKDISEYFNSKHHMVLLGEWDTLYGRARRCTILNEVLPGSEKQYFCKEGPSPWDDAYNEAYFNRQHNLYFINYLRGLDGRTPNENKTDGFRSQNLITNEVEVPGELPVGPAQLDYLRRLQQELRKLQRHLSANNQELKAIGVIGSDVYDKLLILKALRPHFPRAVFFTTDLDAHMTHSSEYEHTRNLIVASPYGLTLHPELQRGLPPFRDSYQTAMYLTTLYAIEDKEAMARLGENFEWPGPRVYEIGRSGAYDLTISEEGSIHPVSDIRRLWAFVNFKPFFAGLAIVFGVVLLGPLILLVTQEESNWYSGQLAKPLRKAFRKRRKYVFALVVVVAMSAVVITLVTEWKNQEPLVIFEGISAWPTELLRIFALFLSLWFLLKIYLRLETSAESLEHKHQPSSSGRTRHETEIDEEVFIPFLADEPSQKVARNWGQILLMKWQQDTERIPINKVWNEYRLFGKLRWRIARASCWALVYFVFGFCLLKVFGFPAKPLRGDAIAIIDHVALFTSVAALLFLVFFVLDASRLCDGLIQHMSHKNVLWRWSRESAMDQAAVPGEDRRGNLQKTRLIAARTNAVGKCLTYPLLVLLILILSRHSVFDNWDWPRGLVVIYALLVAATLLSGWLPRRSAKRARQVALQMVNAERDELIRSSPGSCEANPRLANLNHAIKEINAIRTGAFSPIGESPLLAAPLIPAGLYGLTELVGVVGHRLGGSIG